ncbi:MAG: AAA family ATPase [Lentisphaeria bacterium]|nr:AAA family ATPase [Lentisphaeria bacterium]
MRRALIKTITKDLKRKMVFLAGPRQVGKTTLSKQALPDARGYLNWDIPDHRRLILERSYPDCPMLVFDELHKLRRWRDYLKGYYDDVGQTYQTLVTGSARLDALKHGGDSLQGRYHYHRMLPLTADELAITTQSDLKDLLRLGGFPEPFFSGEALEARRWTREYQHLLINEEIASLENVSDLGLLQLLAMRLPDLVASPLSINALREDLQVAHKTVASWLNIFERLYMIFRLAPFGAPAIRAVKKEQKLYFMDWNIIPTDGPRFENMLALHLLNLVFRAQDERGLNWELRYFRDRDGREVDFVIVDRFTPLLAVEAKFGDAAVAKSLTYFKGKFPEAKAYQVSFNQTRGTVSMAGVKKISMLDFCARDWLEILTGGGAGTRDA